MAHKTDFMYCHSIIEQNKRQSRRSTLMTESQMPTPTAEFPPQPSISRSTSQPSSAEINLVQQTLKEAQIDSHFPFDPYKLPLSATYINAIYRTWDSGGLDDEEDEDTETENENNEEEEEEDSSMVASSADSTASSLLVPPAGSIPMQSLIDPALLGDDPFSKSFEAMSVSPRRNTLILSSL
jgi:RNA polymerase I-specific transcription initiation factor RRN3